MSKVIDITFEEAAFGTQKKINLTKMENSIWGFEYSKEDSARRLSRIENNVFVENEPILSLEDIAFLQDVRNRVYIDESIKKYQKGIELSNECKKMLEEAKNVINDTEDKICPNCGIKEALFYN